MRGVCSTVRPHGRARGRGARLLHLATGGGAAVKLNALITREDLSDGQRVRSYTIERWTSSEEGWVAFPTCTGAAECDPFGRGRGGVHGLSIGARMIDLVPEASARRVRLRCTSSIAADGRATIRSFSAHWATPPVGTSNAERVMRDLT